MRGAERFLIDTSAASRLSRRQVAADWREVIKGGRIGMCAVTEVELLYSARSLEDMERMRAEAAALFTWYHMPEALWSTVSVLQRELVKVGAHRSAGPVDLMLAATALNHRLTVLHYDHDFETIARHTDLKTCWLAEPGSIP